MLLRTDSEEDVIVPVQVVCGEGRLTVITYHC